MKAPATRVYDLISDIPNMGAWSPETKRSKWVGGATTAAVGAKFRGTNTRRMTWRTACEVTAADRGKEFAFVVGRGSTSWNHAFAASDSGCVVTESFTILRQPGPLGRWLTKLATGVRWSEREADLLAGMERTLSNLKVGAEAPAAEVA